jgi:hypothetical protein
MVGGKAVNRSGSSGAGAPRSLKAGQPYPLLASNLKDFNADSSNWICNDQHQQDGSC